MSTAVQAQIVDVKVADVTLVTPTVRDPVKWPFAHTSFWNTPIGAGAVYVPANLPAIPRANIWAGMPQVDEELIILKATGPVTEIRISTVGWTGGDRCVPTGGTLFWAPLPADFLVPNTRNNNSAVFLATDGRTLIHTQPLTRCIAGAGGTSWATYATVDLYSDGRSGSHGGSRLSAIGGTIRIGELRPGGQPPRHALKVDVDARTVLYKCLVKTDCYRWPSYGADSYAVGAYGTLGTNAPAAMKMGSLLAIPASVDLTKIGLETKPGQMIAWTLQNYGAYIVDDSGGANFVINAEKGPDGSKRDEFKKDWGYDLQAVVRDNTPWVRDLQRLMPLLAVVDNNSELTPGGPGVRRQALAPAIAPPIK
ncbi:MAG: hypothetical protein V4463_05895 [Pseudomonadota bacterium]